MSGSHLPELKRYGEPEEKGRSSASVKSTSQGATALGNDGAGHEQRIANIAKSIADTGEGHRKAMYIGAAECAAMARRIEPTIDASGHLFGGKLKQHWLKKKKNASEIYRFLVQSAFSDHKQASKVFTATRVMFEEGISADRFVKRLERHGGFDKLRVRDANKAAEKGLNCKTSSAESDEEDVKGELTDDKLDAPHIDPAHPKITAVYSRMFRSKVESMTVSDRFEIEAVVLNGDKKKPLIRIVALQKITDQDQDKL